MHIHAIRTLSIQYYVNSRLINRYVFSQEDADSSSSYIIFLHGDKNCFHVGVQIQTAPTLISVQQLIGLQRLQTYLVAAR